MLIVLAASGSLLGSIMGAIALHIAFLENPPGEFFNTETGVITSKTHFLCLYPGSSSYRARQ